MRRAPRIHRTPMLGSQRWTVYYEHPVNGQPYTCACLTRWGARLHAWRVLRAYRAAGLEVQP